MPHPGYLLFSDIRS